MHTAVGMVGSRAGKGRLQGRCRTGPPPQDDVREVLVLVRCQQATSRLDLARLGCLNCSSMRSVVRGFA